jgi:hypothetical protein
MSYSGNLLITVDLSDPVRFAIPVPIDEEPLDRATTKFHMVSEGQAISFLGTYDQILDFAAEIGQKAMSWPIVTGHMEWIGQRAITTEHKEGDTDDGSNNGHGSEVRDGSSQE